MKALLGVLLLVGCGPSASHPTETHLPPATVIQCPSTLPTTRTDLAAASRLLGQPVARVCVVGGSKDAHDLVEATVATKAGVKLEGQRVHDDLLAVLALPIIDDASVYAMRAQDGVTLLVSVVERPVITGLSFVGVHAFTKNELDAVPLAAGQRFDVRVVRAFTASLKQAYEDRTYGAAKIDYAITKPEPGKVGIVITVDEGQPWRFGHVSFEGNKTLSTADLAQAAGIKTGDAWNAPLFERASLLVQALAYDRGLLESHVKADRGEPATDGAVPIKFVIQEGNVYTVRKLSIAGVAPAEANKLLALLKTKPKKVFSRAVATADIQTLQTELGMNVEPEVTLDPPTKAVDLVFRVATKK